MQIAFVEFCPHSKAAIIFCSRCKAIFVVNDLPPAAVNNSFLLLNCVMRFSIPERVTFPILLVRAVLIISALVNTVCLSPKCFKAKFTASLCSLAEADLTLTAGGTCNLNFAAVFCHLACNLAYGSSFLSACVNLVISLLAAALVAPNSFAICLISAERLLNLSRNSCGTSLSSNKPFLPCSIS